MYVLWNEQFLDDPTSLRHSESGAISIIFEQAIHRFSNWIRAEECNFLTDILDLVYLGVA